MTFNRMEYRGRYKLNRLIDNYLIDRFGAAKTCAKCERTFRAVRRSQIICNCCRPMPPNRPIVEPSSEGDDHVVDT